VISLPALQADSKRATRRSEAIRIAVARMIAGWGSAKQFFEARTFRRRDRRKLGRGERGAKDMLEIKMLDGGLRIRTMVYKGDKNGFD
jgi:hypothetical protein